MTVPIPFPSLAAQGWQCPVCGRVYAPYVSMCYGCPSSTGATTMTTVVHGGLIPLPMPKAREAEYPEEVRP